MTRWPPTSVVGILTRGGEKKGDRIEWTRKMRGIQRDSERMSINSD